MLKEISGASRWNFRACLCAVVVGALVGCGGGSDPLDVGGSDSSGSVDLRAAYDRLNQCGITIQQAREVVGVNERFSGSTWTWYENNGGPSDQLGELEVSATTYRESSLKGFPEDGVQRAFEVRYLHGKQGISIVKNLCE